MWKFYQICETLCSNNGNNLLQKSTSVAQLIYQEELER